MSRTKLFTYIVEGDTLTVSSEGFDSVVASLSSIPSEIHAQILMHGLKQLIGDAAAAKTGTPVPERLESMLAKVAQLYVGKFTAERKSSGPQAGKRLRAFFRLVDANPKWGKKFTGLTDRTLDTIRTWYTDQTDEMRKAINASPEVKSELAAMAAEEAKDSSASLMA